MVVLMGGGGVTDVDDDCTCEFDPYEDADDESWHYRRACKWCGTVWWGLHCPHDGVQNPCPDCGRTPGDRPTPLERLFPST